MSRVHVDLGAPEVGTWKGAEGLNGIYFRRFTAYRNHPRLQAMGTLVVRPAIADSSPVLLISEATGDLPEGLRSMVEVKYSGEKRSNELINGERNARGLVVSGLRTATTL